MLKLTLTPGEDSLDVAEKTNESVVGSDGYC